MKDDFDNNIIEVVHQCCIHVDKDELIKALNYDREQYEKGYAQGYLDAQLEIKNQNTAQWLINSDGYYFYCSNCKQEPKGKIMTNFCPNCGKEMRGD